MTFPIGNPSSKVTNQINHVNTINSKVVTTMFYRSMKLKGEKISMLTSYDYSMAVSSIRQA